MEGTMRMKKFLIASLAVIILFSLLTAGLVTTAFAAEPTTAELTEAFKSAVDYWHRSDYFNDWAMITRVGEDYQDIFWEVIDSNLPEHRELFEKGIKVPASEYEEKLFKYFEVPSYLLEYIRESANYDEEAQTYTVEFLGGMGGATKRQYSGFVNKGDYYEIYLCDYEYLSLEDLLPEGVTLQEFLESQGFPEEIVYEGYSFIDYYSYKTIIGVKNSGKVFRAEYNDGVVRLLSMEDFTAANMPVKFDDSSSDPVSVDAPTNFRVSYGDAFLPGTRILINRAQSSKAAKAIRDIARDFVVYEITAIYGDLQCQPRNAVTIAFPHPEEYSDVAIYYMDNKGNLTELDAEISDQYNKAVVSLDHFSAYIVADKASSPANVLPGDVNADGKVNIRDAATILLYISGKPVECFGPTVDTNGDGVIDAKDAENILRNITGDPNAVLKKGETCAHELKHVAFTPSTCKTEGTKEHWECTKCSLLFADASGFSLITKAVCSLPLSTEHTPGDWVVDVPPTATQPGVRSLYCLYCNAFIKNGSIPYTGTEGLIYYPTSDETGYIVAGYIGEYVEKLYIPQEYDGLPVVEIYPEAFRFHSFKEVHIPGSIKYIGSSSFELCRELKNVYLSDGIEYIDKYAFRDCSSLENIVIPEGVIIIDEYAFGSCSSLKSISFPKSVEYIATSALERTNLDSISVDKDNPYYSGEGNCLIEKETKTLIKGFSNSVIPADGSVTIIGEEAFYDCEGLTSIVIPEGVRRIEKNAFLICADLESVSIPASVTEIIDNPFMNCMSLKSITLDSNNLVYHMANDCLIETATKILKAGLSTGVIPLDGSVTVIGNGAFSAQTELENVVLPDCITKIGDYAFCYCFGLSSINIPEGVEYIGNAAFYGCEGITEFKLPASLRTIGDSAFGTTGIKSITIPAGVTLIMGNPFEESLGLESITVEAGNTAYHSEGNCLIETAAKTLIGGCKNSILPTNGSVTVIGDRAFFGQTSLVSFTIPNCITKIGEWAFGNCNNLQLFTFVGSETEWKNVQKADSWKRNSAFTEVTFDLSGAAPSEGLEFDYNSDETGYVVTGIGTCSDTEVIIPATHNGLPVTEIGNDAFSMAEITSVYIPASVKKIAESAFEYCYNLQTVNVAQGLEYIDRYAFVDCISLKSINFPEGLTNIAICAFYGCNNLESVSFPKTIEFIGEDVFCYTGLVSIKVHEDNPYYVSINNCLIEKATKTLIVGCRNSVIPGDGSVEVIGADAFFGCEDLVEIFIPEGVTRIEEGAFGDCDDLIFVSIPASVNVIVGNPFVASHNIEVIQVANSNLVYHSDGNCLIKTESKTLIAGFKNSVIPADGSVTTIGFGAFEDQSKIESIVIPEGIVTIEDNAFAFCRKLKEVSLPSTLKTIGDGAFRYTRLNSITIPVNVTSISSDAFEDNEYLESITVIAGNTVYHSAGNCLIETATNTLLLGCKNSQIPTDGSVTAIADSAFIYQSELSSIVIPKSVTYIGSYAFAYCSNLTSVTFLGTEEEWNSIEKGESWNEGSPFDTVTFSGAHTHSTVTVPGTPAGERTFGTTDYVYCSTCSEVLSEKELILPFGIENPEYYASDWGYEYLATLPNGSAMQQFYKSLDAELTDFHVNTDRQPDSNGYLNPVRYDTFGLSDAEARTVYAIYRDDHPLYYWISTSSALYPGTSFLVMVDEDYLDSATRKYYNDLIYDTAADYLKLVIGETSEYQICWALHDAICMNSKYAYKSGTNTPESASWAHSIIGIIEKNTGVCESYAEVFGLLLNFAEVENIRVSGLGNGGGHAWNLVKLDNGEWYWYDLTWDDRDTGDVYEVFQGYAAVTDYQEVTVKIGGGSFEPLYFLQKHSPYTDRNYGVNYNPVLPERAANPFETEDTMIYDTFTVEGTTYQVIRFDTVYCCPYLGIGSTPPETITYNGREYKVIVDN